MGVVVSFPEAGGLRERPALGARRAAATVIILPVVHIQRDDMRGDRTDDGGTPPKRPRRRKNSRV